MVILTPLVFRGDSVSTGTPIGITGQSGKVTGEHLHLGIMVNRQPVDPVNFLYQLINTYHEQKFQTITRGGRQ
ncbi:M23 family metallopeptidase [Mucilaginibacter gynuensis]|uniref:M23 family metallopeptidase n=1 Tax=Mucilaginibacter gynuensis TaxID=1302236 RepID=UPI003CD080F8